MKLISLIIAFIFGFGAAKSEVANETQPTSNSGKIVYSSFLASPDKITLIENYADHQKSTKLVSDNNCSAGINGGFYDTNNQALGLVVVDGVQRSKTRTSGLFNGYVSDQGIKRDEPVNANWALQTGPLLIENGNTNELILSTDKPARRMIAATDNKHRLRLITLYVDNSRFDGPTLEELPKTLNDISHKENWGLVNAINLDGGSASAFYSDNLALTELSPVGSWLCLK